MTKAIKDLVKFIQMGKWDDELDTIILTARERSKGLKKVRATQKFVNLNRGDKVVFNDETRPLYLQGTIGTIKSKKQSKVIVDLDVPAGRFHKNISVPVNLLDKV